jgi:cytoskeletal protein RodZ
LRQIANATKISVSVLAALERNDLAHLPGGLYGRAFVRAYAIEVGLDPDEISQEFVTESRDSLTAGHRTAEPVDDNLVIESTRQMANTFLRLALVSVPTAGLILYLGAAGGRATSVARQQPRSPATVIAEPAPAPLPGSASSPVEGATVADRLRVALSASRSCWLSATVDGTKVFEREVGAGEQQTFDVRRELLLMAGDAAAITMTLNGAAARPLGQAGELVTTRLSPTNFTEYLVAR